MKNKGKIILRAVYNIFNTLQHIFLTHKFQLKQIQKVSHNTILCGDGTIFCKTFSKCFCHSVCSVVRLHNNSILMRNYFGTVYGLCVISKFDQIIKPLRIISAKSISTRSKLNPLKLNRDYTARITFKKRYWMMF